MGPAPVVKCLFDGERSILNLYDLGLCSVPEGALTRPFRRSDAGCQLVPLWDLLWNTCCLDRYVRTAECSTPLSLDVQNASNSIFSFPQWFVGLSIAVLVPAPAKLAVYWFPENGRHVMSTLWGGSLLVGIGLPFLIVPPIYGVDGHGRYESFCSFLSQRALLTVSRRDALGRLLSDLLSFSYWCC